MQLRWYQEEAVDSLFDFFARVGGSVNGVPVEANPLICLPTGTGKSLVIAAFTQRVFGVHASTRMMMLTHVKPLIEQNAAKLRQFWPLAPLGIYSAGLGSRDTMQPIIFGGVKSVIQLLKDNPRAFGFIDLLVVDEAHLIPGEGDSADYLKVIALLKQVNPFLKVIGLTATPYRLGLGLMTNGKIFTHIAYDLCNLDGFNRLMAEGHLAPLVVPSKDSQGQGLVQIDTTGIGKSAGDYNSAQLEAAAEKVTYAALKQTTEFGLAQNRRSWMVFAAGVHHAEMCGEILDSFGISNVVIHSKKTGKHNDDALEAYQRGEVRAAVNMNSLTTGVDHPPLDLIACLRSTMSTGLWVQMLGRGTRPFDWFKLSPQDQLRLMRFEGFVKSDCLVLDYAGNTARLGPINDPVIPRMRGQGAAGDAPVKICGSCGVYNHTSARVCVACGQAFDIDLGIAKKASNLEVLRSDLPQIEPFDVQFCILTAHTGKQSGRNMVKVAYTCGLRTFYEHISVEAAGFWGKKSRDWLRQRWGEPWEGMTNADLISLANQMRHPRRITVWVNKTQPEIMTHEF